MNPGLRNIFSEASVSEYAKFEGQQTRPSWFIPESWKSILKLHGSAAHVWNLYIQLAELPKTLSIALTILVDLVMVLLALSCMSSTNSCGLKTVFPWEIDFKNYWIKVPIYPQLAWKFLSHLGLSYSSIVQSIEILHKCWKPILSN